MITIIYVNNKPCGDEREKCVGNTINEDEY